MPYDVKTVIFLATEDPQMEFTDRDQNRYFWVNIKANTYRNVFDLPGAWQDLLYCMGIRENGDTPVLKHIMGIET